MQSFLKFTTKLLGAAAVGAMLSSSVLAGEPYGGMKGDGNGVPVPAPMPVPDFAAQYYFRMDVAYGWNDASGLSTSYSDATISYLDSLRDDDGFGEFGRYGIGMGMYFNSYLRGDITFDMRNETNGLVDRNDVYDTGLGTNQWRSRLIDEVHSRDATMLFNGYVDLPISTRFRPYVGAGVGFAVHRMRRNFFHNITCETLDVAEPSCDPANPTAVADGGTIANASGSEKDWSFGFAGALMAGAVWEMSDNWKLDIGYRFLHLTSVDFTHPIEGTVSGVNNGITGSVTIPDQNIHELRVGLRYDIN